MASISKRGNAYRVLWREPDPTTGKPRLRQQTVRTRREAETLRAEVKHRQDVGTYVSPSGRTVGDLLDEWLGVLEHDVANDTLSPTTVRTYRNYLDNHVRTRWAGLPLQRLTDADVRGMFVELATATDDAPAMAPSSRRQLYVLMKRMLRYAQRKQYVHRNVLELVDPPKVKSNSGRDLALTPEQLRAFLDHSAAVDHDLHAAWVLAAHTGMRRGELAGLRWSDVDLDARELRVMRNRPLRGVEKEPKTVKGRRTVPLTAGAVDALRALRRRQAEDQLRAGAAYERTGYVLADELGAPIDPNRLSKEFARLRADAGLPDSAVLHSLRHTHVTVLLDAGTNPKVVSDRVGHTDVAFTMRTYQHPSDDAARQAAEGFERALAGR